MRFPWGFDEEDDRCQKLKMELAQQIMALRQRGVTQFLTACDCGVGLYAAEIVNGLRETTDQDLMLFCYIPHEEQATKWAPYLRERYFTMLEKCTHISVVCPVGTPDAQLQAYGANVQNPFMGNTYFVNRSTNWTFINYFISKVLPEGTELNSVATTYTLKDGAKISGAGATDVTAASYTFNFTAGNILTVANDTESRTYNAQLAVEGQSVIVQRDPTTGIRNYDVDLTEVINSTYYSDTTIKNKVDEIVTAWNAYIAEPHTFDAGTSVMAVLQDFDEWATENEDPETRESYFTGTSDFGGGSYLSKLNNLNWNDCGSMGGYMYTNDANGLYNANIEGLNTRTGKSSIPMVAANNMTFTSSTRIVWFFTVNYSNWF